MSWTGYKEAAAGLHVSRRTIGRLLASGALVRQRLTARTILITIADTCSHLRTVAATPGPVPQTKRGSGGKR